MTDKERIKQLCNALHQLQGVARAAYEELEFGGDWQTARLNLRSTILSTNQILKQHWPEELGPMYFGDPFCEPSRPSVPTR